MAVAERIRDAVAGHPEHAAAPCHNDLLAANFLCSGEHVMLLDWEYAGMNDPFFDLGNLAVNNGFDDATADRLLAAVFGSPATDRRRAALALFRMMSDFREAMWGVAQGVLSELDFDYAQYAGEHFERLRNAVANPELEELIRIAAAP
jgi:thiamine kinase-like enzyme